MLIHYCDCIDIQGYALELFDEICQLYLSGGDIEVSTKKEEYAAEVGIIKYLELKGFVITTESGINTMLVKPIGVKFIDDACLICVEQKEES